MSRHKLVKNLDLDDELDDYDGYDEDAGAEGKDGHDSCNINELVNTFVEISADDRRKTYVNNLYHDSFPDFLQGNYKRARIKYAKY